MSTFFRRVGLEPSVVAQAPTCRPEQREQRNHQRTEQQQSVPAFRFGHPNRTQPHAEAQVLDIATTPLDTPALGVVSNHKLIGTITLPYRRQPKVKEIEIPGNAKLYQFAG